MSMSQINAHTRYNSQIISRQNTSRRNTQQGKSSGNFITTRNSMSNNTSSINNKNNPNITKNSQRNLNKNNIQVSTMYNRSNERVILKNKILMAAKREKNFLTPNDNSVNKSKPKNNNQKQNSKNKYGEEPCKPKISDLIFKSSTARAQSEGQSKSARKNINKTKYSNPGSNSNSNHINSNMKFIFLNQSKNGSCTSRPIISSNKYTSDFIIKSSNDNKVIKNNLYDTHNHHKSSVLNNVRNEANKKYQNKKIDSGQIVRGIEIKGFSRAVNNLINNPNSYFANSERKTASSSSSGLEAITATVLPLYKPPSQVAQ